MLKYAGVVEWQTRLTQNQEGNRGGSSPFTGTKKAVEKSTAFFCFYGKTAWIFLLKYLKSRIQKMRLFYFEKIYNYLTHLLQGSRPLARASSRDDSIYVPPLQLLL